MVGGVVHASIARRSTTTRMSRSSTHHGYKSVVVVSSTSIRHYRQRMRIAASIAVVVGMAGSAIRSTIRRSPTTATTPRQKIIHAQILIPQKHLQTPVVHPPHLTQQEQGPPIGLGHMIRHNDRTPDRQGGFTARQAQVDIGQQ